MLKYVWEGDVTSMTVDDVKSYIAAFKDGSLTPHLKSEPVPEDNTDPLTILVGKNFEEIVFDETKDVLVKYYAPWCGHCKKLAPIWDELGEKFKDSDKIAIAKTDATTNEFLDVKVSIIIMSSIPLHDVFCYTHLSNVAFTASIRNEV